MIAALRRFLDARLGGGANQATVPPLDGVLGPNQAIEEAPAVVEVAEPDNLVSDGAQILFSTGVAVMRLAPGGAGAAVAEFARFDRPVAALALHAGGGLAVGLEDGPVLLRGDRHGGKVFAELGGRRVSCPTALCFVDADTLLVALGSRRNAPDRWRHDLMQRNASGSVWRCDLASGAAACLADELAWPCGLLPLAEGGVVVSEAWRNRLVKVRPGAAPAVELADIAGYPGRIAPAARGEGAWLSVFAPRSQLVEFVLRERDYREAMMREVDPAHWIAPSLAPARSFLEPMQVGGLKQLGIRKPWAPTRSYGLVIGLDTAREPRVSFHSRADGRRHGITSAVEAGGRLLATSRGGGAIMSIPLGPGG